MNMPLIGGDKIRSLIKNATKDSSTGSNESLMKTNTRDSNNMIKSNEQLEMDRKNKIIVDNLKKSGGIIRKPQEVIKSLGKSVGNNMGGGINVSQGGNLNNSEIKSRGLNIESGVNNVNDINNANVNNNIEGIRINKNNGVLTNPSNGRINGWGGGGGGWGDEGTIENETIGDSKRMSQAVVDLYKVAGRLNEREEELDIDKLRNSFSEFDELTDDVLGDLVADLKVMNEEGDEDLLKIIEAYPELGKVRLSDLNDASKAALLGGLVDGDDSKWGLVDYVLFAPNLISKGFGGKKMTDYRGDFADWAYDSKKMIQYTQKDEGEFLKDLHDKYAEYTNANGEWLPNATPEIKKQYKKEWDEYERKATLNNVGNSIANFFKGLPKVVDVALNIANHPEDLIKTLPRLLAGAPATGTEWIADKMEEKTGNNFLDKLAQRKGVETWQEMKEMMYDKASKGKGAFNKVAAWVLGSSEVSDGMREYIVDSYGSEENFVQTLVERPEDVISDAISIAEGAVGIAKGAGIIDAARAEMIIKNLGYFDMYEMSTKGAFQAEKWLLKNELDLAKKGLGKTMKNTEKFGGLLKRSPIGKMVSFVENKLTGLTEEERKFIRENGDIVEEYLKGNKSAEEIADMIMSRFDDLIEGKKAVGQFYDFIKNNEKLTVKTSGIVSGIKGLLNELGIKIDRKGNLKFGALSYTPAQQRQLQQVYNYVKALEGLGDTATAKDVRRARQLIDSLINWEGNTKMGLDAEVMNSIRNMRGKIDDALKEQVKGFKEADAEYRELTNLVKELKKDWFTKDGKLKDNALSKIRNLTNKGNEAKLERLEKQFPGITRALKGLGVSQSIEKASKMMVGQYAQQLLIGGGLWKLINGDLSVATALIGAGILTPKNLVKILKKEGDFMSKWRSVADNLSNGKVLSDEKINRLKRWLKDKSQEIGQKVAEEEGGKGWEKVDMDKVDLEYEKGQKKAYAGGKVTEKKLTKDERASLLKKYAKGSENNGFLMKIVDSMGEGEHGLTDLDNKLIKLEQNPGDTTIQHEFFHALFSVIDDDTKKYVINEVKNYLGLTDDVAAEERLAESFGIYARRREIKLGNIRLKGNRLQRFRSRISDLFQRAYEWIQDYSMDRKTINKLFNEVYGAVDGKVLDESGKFNLAEKLGINEKTPKLGVNENGLRYKKGGNLGKNDYTTNGLKKMETSVLAPNGKSNGLSEKVSTKPSTNFFELKDGKKNYILVDFADGKGKQKVYGAGGGRNQFTKRRLQLSNKNLDYRKNLDRLNSWLSDGDVGMSKSVLVGRTGKGKSIRLSKQGLYHIYEKHGAIDFDTLIEAINDPTRQKQETVGDKRFRYEIDLGGNDDRVLLLGLNGHTFKKGDLIIEKDANKVQSYSIAGASERESSKVPSKDVRLKRDTNKGLDVKDKQDGKIRYKRVRHGSPADFEKFDSSHMGEGEGAQAHGWGHYVAVDEQTGRHYADMGKDEGLYKGMDGGELNVKYGEMVRKNKDYTKEMGEINVVKGIMEDMKSGKSFEESKKDMKKKLQEWNKQSPSNKLWEKSLEAIDDIKEGDIEIKRGHNLYEVEIPDPVKKDTPTGSNYLEEKGEITTKQFNKIKDTLIKKEFGSKFDKLKPISDMTEKDIDVVIDKAKKTDPNLALKLEQEKEVSKRRFQTSFFTLGEIFETQMKGRLNGKDYIKLFADEGFKPNLLSNAKNGRELYTSLYGFYGSDKEASKFLESLGYDGIHYFGGRDGEAYVIFNDDSAKIENHIRYKKDQTKTPEFRKWFEGSKVVKADGKPQVVYHGTTADFNVFNKIGGAGIYGDGYYFTDKIGTAKNYGADGGKVMKVYLDIKNPYEATMKDQYGLNVKKLKEQGYDGVKAKLGNETYWVAFDSNQIKSATDNVGTFDKNNPDIRYKKGWHGSPAEFDRFDSTHIGEGEGAQAHGWGHYIAVDEKTGRYYADVLNGAKYKGKEKYQLADLGGHEYNVLTTILDKVSDGVEPGKAIEDTKKWYNELIDEKKEILKTEKDLNERDWAEKEINRYNERLKVLDGLKEDDFKSSKGNRNLYEVEIPDPVKRDTPTGSNYIEEDSKIGDKAFNKMIKWFEDDGWKVEEHYGNYDVEKGGVAFNLTNGDNTWRELIRDEIEDQKAFSEVLDRMGYDGIHYYGGRDGESYVIFNDKKATITNHLRFKKGLNKKLGSVGVMNSKGNMGGLSRKGLGTMAKGLRYKQQQDLKN